MIELVVFDLDNVIIDGEAIDEIGKLANVEEDIAEITEKAMKGEIDFETSIKDRVQLLEGTSIEDIEKVACDLPLMPGAEKTISCLKDKDVDVAIISGSFDVVADKIKDKLGVDTVYTNSFTVEDGKLTGEVTGPLVSGSKLDVLKDHVEQAGITLDEVVAVGDGANDISMIESAGCGIAFNAKDSVKEIADEAFYNTYIKTVELQDNIVKIGNSSFAECSYLEEVNFGKNIKSIGDYAFSNCYYLTNISLPSGINEIGNNAFQHCRSIKEIKLPNSLTKLGTRAFAHCYYLQTIELSNQLVEVPDFCFQYCSNLSNIELPDSIITIGDSAFTYCENLKNIKLSKNIVIIERYAFNYCNNLESTLDLERVQSIGEHAFYACTKLRTILLSEAIKYIDGYAFHHCYALTIYCELPQALSNWDYYWNSYDVPVVWGYKK